MISNLRSNTDEDSRRNLTTDLTAENSSNALRLSPVVYSDDEQGAYHIEQDDEDEDNDATSSDRGN